MGCTVCNRVIIIIIEKPTLRQLQLLKLKTVPEGLSFRIIEALAPKWKDLAIEIDFDPDGRHIELIETEHGREGPVACCRKVLMDWLRGGFQPPGNDSQTPTWENMLEILKNIQENDLATKIHDSLSRQ